VGAGRPPLSRSIYSFEDSAIACPRELVLDTSFVIHALVASEPLHQAARGYIARLIESGTTVYFNRLLELELAEVVFRLALVERFGRANVAKYQQDGRARRRAGRLLANANNAWQYTLSLLPYVRVEVDEVSDDVPGIMRRYGLRSYDAVHVATALYAQVPAMLTLDTGFASMPQTSLSIYTNASRVTACRAVRNRRSVTA
jgi:predicted nucleic acid-binding protein